MNIVEAQCTANPPMIRNRFVVECADTQTLKSDDLAGCATSTRCSTPSASRREASRPPSGRPPSPLAPCSPGRARRQPRSTWRSTPRRRRAREARGARRAAPHRGVLDRHVEVLEALADSLPALTDASRRSASSSRRRSRRGARRGGRARGQCASPSSSAAASAPSTPRAGQPRRRAAGAYATTVSARGRI